MLVASICLSSSLTASHARVGVHCTLCTVYSYAAGVYSVHCSIASSGHAAPCEVSRLSLAFDQSESLKFLNYRHPSTLYSKIESSSRRLKIHMIP